jgi:hypothetical protein
MLAQVNTEDFSGGKFLDNRCAAALLLLYCCFTAALLLLYCCFSFKTTGIPLYMCVLIINGY